MPGATIYDPKNKDIREASDKELQERRKLIEQNQKYYDGKMAKPLKDDKDNVLLNLCRQVVDETVAFLVPDMPSFEIDNEFTVSDDEAWLADQWQKNGGATLLQSMAVNGSLGGQVFSRVIGGEGDNHKILNLPPENVVKFWDVDDTSRVLWYEIHWTERSGGAYIQKTKKWRQDIVWLGSDWEIITYHEGANRGSWVEFERVNHGSPLGPLVDWQHLTRANEPYGEHELPHKGLNDAVNAVASDIKSILRYHAFPTTVGTGFEADKLEQTSVDGFLTVANENAKVYNVEMQSDLSSSMNMLDILTRRFFSQSRVVIVSGGPDAFRNMTNLGIKAAFMPMIAKNEQLRRNYTRGIQEINKRLMMFSGIDIETEVGVEWGSALPMDEREEIANIQQLMAMGIMSKETAAGRMGLNWFNENQKILDETVNDSASFMGAPLGISG